MARKKQVKKRKKKPPPKPKTQRKMRWWDWVIIVGGVLVAFAFVIWAGSIGALTPSVPEIEDTPAPTQDAAAAEAATPVASAVPETAPSAVPTVLEEADPDKGDSALAP